MTDSNQNNEIPNNNELQIPETKISEIICPSCKFKQSSNNKFCEKCGQDFSSDKIRTPLRNRRNLKPGKERREKRAHGANINDGRIMILVIAIATFIFYLLSIHIINIFLLVIQIKYDFLIEENDQNIFNMLTFIPLGMGVIYLGLFIWSFKNIFAALLITLILYSIETSLVLALGYIPHPLILVFKMVVIFFLALSVKASIKIRHQGESVAKK